MGAREGKWAPGGPEHAPLCPLLLLPPSALGVSAAGAQRKSQTDSAAFPCSGRAKSAKALGGSLRGRAAMEVDSWGAIGSS